MTSGDTPGGWPPPPGSDGPTPGAQATLQASPPARPPAPSQPPPVTYVQALQPVPGQVLPGQASPPAARYAATPHPYPPGLYPQPVWVPAAPPAPATAGRTTVLALVLALVVAVVGVTGLGAFAVLTGALSAPTWQSIAPQDPPPPAEAPVADWAAWAQRSVSDTVKGQATALLAGDEAAFEGVADPADQKLTADLRRRFTVLRALGPGVWTQSIGEVKTASSRSWSADIKISYCFGDSSCVPASLTETSRWSVRNDRLVLVALIAAKGDQQGPRPWENDNLVVKQGSRVIVATTKINEYRLASAVQAADEAAAIADTFAQWQAKPNRYLVFLAATHEWASWYGGNAPAWAAGWTVQVADNASEVMISTDQVGQRDLQELLTHEFAHVTTLPGVTTTTKTWWLVEGIAEYAAMLGKPTIAYDKYEPTRAFVHKGWDGRPDVAPPSSRATDEDAAARYGVAFLAVRRVAEKYTPAKMLDFFDRVVHKGATPDVAAPAALGASWSSVSADLTSSIRRAVL